MSQSQFSKRLRFALTVSLIVGGAQISVIRAAMGQQSVDYGVRNATATYRQLYQQYQETPNPVPNFVRTVRYQPTDGQVEAPQLPQTTGYQPSDETVEAPQLHQTIGYQPSNETVEAPQLHETVGYQPSDGTIEAPQLRQTVGYQPSNETVEAPQLPQMIKYQPTKGRIEAPQHHQTIGYQPSNETVEAPQPQPHGTRDLRLPNTANEEGRLPENAFFQFEHREHPNAVAFNRSDRWGLREFNWKPTNLAHRPAYFEHVMLERHGQTASPLFQPVFSGIRFVSNAALLPYNMTIQPAGLPASTLGHYRVGSWAPSLRQRPPLRADAATVQAGATAGLILLIP